MEEKISAPSLHRVEISFTGLICGPDGDLLALVEADATHDQRTRYLLSTDTSRRGGQTAEVATHVRDRRDPFPKDVGDVFGALPSGEIGFLDFDQHALASIDPTSGVVRTIAQYRPDDTVQGMAAALTRDGRIVLWVDTVNHEPELRWYDPDSGDLVQRTSIPGLNDLLDSQTLQTIFVAPLT